MNKSPVRWAALGAFSLLEFGGGCAVNLGAGAGAGHPVPTIGQQLIDLQKARDSGALSASDYEAQRAKVLAAPVPSPPP
jgi:hypothetical protein